MSGRSPVPKKVIINLALMLLTTGLLLLFASLPAHYSGLHLGQGRQPQFFHLTLQPAVAQRLRQSEVWQRVYEAIPDFPQENQYINAETGDIAVNNTLASRLIRYHTLIKGRPPNFRFDWKLTLADYLGANSRMFAESYPGADTLRTNPLEGDRTAIRSLNRAQRNQLVDILVSIFSYPASETPPASSPNLLPSPSPLPSRPVTPATPTPPITPRPGDAQLLL